MNEDIFREIVRLQAEGKSAAVATITAIEGSTPRGTGSKMLVRDDGSLIGSIGGGSAEAQVCTEAANVISCGEAKMLHFDLRAQGDTEQGMICGGIMDVFLEPILPKPTLYLFGGGHISQSLSKVGKMVGFRIVVVDDREEFANPVRFPEADETIANNFDELLPTLRLGRSAYIAIITRGHSLDEKVLEWAVQTDACYIGMIGSKRKIKTVFGHLTSRGIAPETLKNVHSPIGLDIQAETPEEIAISILAEIIKIRRGKELPKSKNCMAY